MTDDDIRSKVRVLLNDGSSEHASKEAAASLAVFALVQLRTIAAALDVLANGRIEAVREVSKG